MNKLLLKIVCCLGAALLISGSALAEELLTDQDLFAEPKVQSAISAKAKKGSVSILEKQGFWVKIKSGEATGWTKLSNVKASTAGILDLGYTGRGSSGNIVSTSGVRGLDGGDLINAKPDFTEFGKFASSKTTKDQSLSFAKSGGLETRKVDFIVPTTK